MSLAVVHQALSLGVVSRYTYLRYLTVSVLLMLTNAILLPSRWEFFGPVSSRSHGVEDCDPTTHHPWHKGGGGHGDDYKNPYSQRKNTNNNKDDRSADDDDTEVRGRRKYIGV